MKVLECKGMFDCMYVVCVCYLLALYIHMYEYFYLRVCIFIMFICMIVDMCVSSCITIPLSTHILMPKL